MPRKKLIRQNQFPYHVTTRSNNKDWFKIPIHKVWDITKESMEYAIEKETVTIHCFVLMSNHYHLLISSKSGNIDKYMMHFNRRLSKLIRKHSGAINHKFANRYNWSIIDNQNYLTNVYRYIYQNPVRAGVTTKPQFYPYSSLQFSSYEKKKFHVYEHFDFFNSKSYFEKRFSKEFEAEIFKALKKSYFKPSSKASIQTQRILKNIS